MQAFVDSAEGSSRERRKHRRYPLKLPVWLEAVPGGSLNKHYCGNLSAGGLLLGTNLPFAPDMRLRVYIALPYFLDLVVAHCIVRHVGSCASGCRYQVGLEFEETDGVNEVQMISFLTALHES